MAIEVKLCEQAEIKGGCKERAQWRVAVGTRSADAQLSCGRHLNRTCWAMVGAESPRVHVALTVTPFLSIKLPWLEEEQ